MRPPKRPAYSAGNRGEGNLREIGGSSWATLGGRAGARRGGRQHDSLLQNHESMKVSASKRPSGGTRASACRQRRNNRLVKIVGAIERVPIVLRDD